jgi:hypothetical protein
VEYGGILTLGAKLACRACHGVVLQRAAPKRLIRGGLTLYPDDGRIEMDANAVERAVRAGAGNLNSAISGVFA